MTLYNLAAANCCAQVSSFTQQPCAYSCGYSVPAHSILTHTVSQDSKKSQQVRRDGPATTRSASSNRRPACTSPQPRHPARERNSGMPVSAGHETTTADAPVRQPKSSLRHVGCAGVRHTLQQKEHAPLQRKLIHKKDCMTGHTPQQGTCQSQRHHQHAAKPSTTWESSHVFDTVRQAGSITP